MKIDYSIDLETVRAKSASIRARAAMVQSSIHERGWALAASVGIGRCMCSVHNASIDDALRGWCSGNPGRLKVAKRAKAILSDWSASRLADVICARLWREFAKRQGTCVGDVPSPARIGNVHLLFRVVSGASVLG